MEEQQDTKKSNELWDGTVSVRIKRESRTLDLKKGDAKEC